MAGPFVYYRAQVQPLPRWQVAPHRIPGLRVSVFFLDMGDRELAEDILQDAFIKVIDRPDQAPAGEGLIPWFYRTLRNAAIDRFRRREAASRAVEAFARELETHAAPPPEIEAEICGCIARLASFAESGIRRRTSGD
jgi:DNA-directed RNA polymerase specialized sigma24 family protein